MICFDDFHSLFNKSKSDPVNYLVTGRITRSSRQTELQIFACSRPDVLCDIVSNYVQVVYSTQGQVNVETLLLESVDRVSIDQPWNSIERTDVAWQTLQSDTKITIFVVAWQTLLKISARMLQHQILSLQTMKTMESFQFVRVFTDPGNMKRGSHASGFILLSKEDSSEKDCIRKPVKNLF